jgi:hypothetical protein
MKKIKLVGLFVGIVLISIGQGFCQNTLQFTGVNATPEKAIQLHWASNTNEVYEIDYADSLIDTNTRSITWNKLCDDYPSQGTNTFWLDTGNYMLSPAIPHPKDSPMRFYRIVLTGTNTGSNPTVTITSPTNGASVTGNLTVTVSASSDQVLANVKLYVDGQEMPPSDDNSNFVINTCEWWNGTHTLFAVAKSLSHFEGIPNDTSITYGHTVSSYVNVTFNNLISEVAFSQPYFEPALGQTQEVTATFAANCDWTLQIQDLNNNTVRNVSGSGNSMTFDWDGTGDGETNIPDGVYTYFISAQTNGEFSQVVVGGSGGNSDNPLSPPFASSSFASLDSSELWAIPKYSSGCAVPLAIYPPGFDTNDLTIFEATPSEMQALKSSFSGAKSYVAIDGSSRMSADNASSAYAGPSGQSTSAPMRPPDTKGKGTIGTFLVGYLTYPTFLYGYFNTPPIPTGWYPLSPRWVALDGRTQSEAQNAEQWGSVFENADIAKGFITTMQNGQWKGSANPYITAANVTGGFFNQANVGLLAVHGSYGTTAETDGVKHSYLRFFDWKSQSSSYCRLDDCSFGGSGTNGLKWMAILACNALNNTPYNSMYYYGCLPINNDLHLLLSASTVETAAPTLGTLWAQKMLGVGTNAPETVEQAWFDAGSQAYIPETNHITITFRVAGWPDAFTDHLSDTASSPGTGNSLDITKQDHTVFSNP